MQKEHPATSITPAEKEPKKDAGTLHVARTCCGKCSNKDRLPVNPCSKDLPGGTPVNMKREAPAD